MDYEELIQNIKKIKLTKKIINDILKCCSNFWEGNYYRLSENTQNEITILQETICDRKGLSRLDIQNIFWILDRYGYHDTINEIIKDNTDKIETIYDLGDD